MAYKINESNYSDTYLRSITNQLARNRTIATNKSYQRLNGKDIITPPKTPKSNRIIPIPPFVLKPRLFFFRRIPCQSL